MKVITQYIADDGTKFSTKVECLKYEREKLNFSSLKDVFLFDNNGREIEKKNFLTDMQRIFYIYIGSENSLKILQKINKGIDYILPEKEGFWKFKTNKYDEGVFINYEEYIDEMKQEFNKFDDMAYDIQCHSYHLNILI